MEPMSDVASLLATLQIREPAEVDDENHTVKLSISVDPGKRVYVNRINFTGNHVTADNVLRCEMRQMEGAWLSNGVVESSKSWLMRLPYYSTVYNSYLADC